MDIEFYRISWDEVTKMAIRLATSLQGRRIFGIPRGGLLVAAIMAYHGCYLVNEPSQANVIVDDISDSGRTLDAFSQTPAALIIRKGCSPRPRYWVMMLNIGDYVLFPYEDEEEVSKQNGFKSGEQI